MENKEETKTVEEKIAERKEFIQVRQHYIDTANKASNFFDKTLITLSTSILGGSMIFINNIKSKTSTEIIHTPGFILGGRISLGFSMLITLISFIFSEEVHHLSIEKYDLEYQNEDDKEKKCDLCKRIGKLEEKIDKKNKIIGFMKRISIISLIVGICLLIVFLFNNIQNDRT